MLTDGLIFKSRGKLFHSRGAAAERALSPEVFLLVLGTFKRCISLERKTRRGVYLTSMSLIYFGARPLKPL